MYKRDSSFIPHKHKLWRPCKAWKNPTWTKLHKFKNQVVPNFEEEISGWLAKKPDCKWKPASIGIENSKITYIPTKYMPRGET